MEVPSTLNIRVDLSSDRARQQLLAGLDLWLRLGLISEGQVRSIGLQLSQRLPVAQPVQEPLDSRIPAGISAEAQPEDFSVTAPAPGRAARLAQSLVTEISVVWLLFLGVFLVIVSSAVLAASQWQAFSPAGQYGVLLTYTLGFWGASLWTQRQERLQTTSKMLAIATFLLLPINVWVIDELGLFQRSTGSVFGAAALVVLSGLPLGLFRQRAFRPYRLNLLALSWLHLGWGWSLWPLAATYAGTVGTSAHLAYQHRKNPELSDKTPKAIVALALVVLLGRSLLVAQVPPTQLGLAWGLCGALLVWLLGRGLGAAAGAALMLLGWGLTVGNAPPLQALGVSGLALGLLAERLRTHWRSQELVGLILVGLQTYWLLWFLLPAGARAGVLAGVAGVAGLPVFASEFAGIAILPAVAGLLGLAGWLGRRNQDALARQTDRSALAVGLGLAVTSCSNPFTLAVNLLLGTGLLAWAVRFHRFLSPQTRRRWAEVAHGVGLGAIAAGIDYLAPELTLLRWAGVWLTIAAVEWGLSVTFRSGRRRLSTWRAGLIAAGLAYLLLIYSLIYLADGSLWLWLGVPVALTGVANHPRAVRSRQAAAMTMVALLLQTPLLAAQAIAAYAGPTWGIITLNFALGTVCTGLNTRRWPSNPAVFFTLGSGLVAAASLWGWVANDADQLLTLGAVEICGLWGLRLGRRTTALGQRYGRMARVWSGLLLGGLYLVLLWLVNMAYETPWLTAQQPVFWDALAAVGLTTAGLGVALWRRATNGRFVGLAAGLGLGTALALVPLEAPLPWLAIALLTLGLVTQLGGDWWVRQRQQPYWVTWHAIPLAYAGLGALLGHLSPAKTAILFDWQLSPLSSTSGLYTLAAALVAIGIGRRSVPTPGRLRWLGYLGLVGISLGAYELLVYRLLQATGGSPGDGWTLLAGLAALIALAQRGLNRWLLPWLRVSASGLQTVAHVHWGLGSLMVLYAVLAGLSQPRGLTLWLGVSLLLAAYALVMGNRYATAEPFGLTPEGWTTVGLVEALLVGAYARFELFSGLGVLLSWGGAIACGIGYGLYRLPWVRWGWPERPWQRLGVWLPVLTLSLTLVQVKTQTLLLVGAFYAWAAQQFGRIRLSYVSVGLGDWALLRYLDRQGDLTALWLSLIFGLSLLYVVQLEPGLQQAAARTQRHSLRTLGSALIGLTALYQAEVSAPAYAGLTLLLGLGLVAAGLGLRVRAFLYVGTATVVLQTLRVLWRFVDANALLLWAIGIVLGLGLIWVAATFESRRSQLGDLLSTWSSLLATWD